MDKQRALAALDALAHETRLDVFRTLVRAGRGGMPAGEIAASQDVRQNTMSSHLAILHRAGLTTRVRQGREILYSANYDTMRALLLYLLEDCCRGSSEICAPLMQAMSCD